METNLILASKEWLFEDKRPFLIPMLEFTTHFPSVNFDRAAFDGLLLEDVLQDDITRDNSDMFFPHDNTNAPSVTSTLDTRSHRSSRPSLIRVASFVSTSLPHSTWFDDSPTHSVFTITDDNASTSSWGNKNQWPDEDIPYSKFPDHECDRISIISFGPLSEMTSSLASDSHDSHTMVPTEDDRESTFSGSKHHIFDCLDDQLLHSPIDSFAAICWDAAVIPENPRLKVNNKTAELRFSKLYNDAAREYEEAHIRESSELAMMTLPRMKFDEAVQLSKTAPLEVAPWLYVSKKATSMLDLPRNSSTALKSHQPSVSPSPATHQRHRRGKTTLGSITKLPFSLSLAGKCQKAINCISREHKA